MKFTSKIAAVILIGIAAGVREGKAAEAASANAVTVCLSNSSSAVVPAVQAEEIATRIFATVSVTISWRRTGRDCPADSIKVSLDPDTPAGLFPRGALAYAHPFEGVRIRVFFDRIHHLSFDRPGLEPSLLAHVLVHEIAHILQATDYHSSSGVMKASWDGGDYTRMMKTGLAFTPLDAVLIKLGMAARSAHYNPGQTLSGSRP